MDPTLTWIDLTSSDRDKMRRVLDMFTETGTVDEMGLGTLRDTLSDALFPGTSSIQTRLRYMLFVPWIYKALEAERVRSEDIVRRVRAAEVEVIAPLLRNEDSDGVIGARAGAAVSRLPSSVYWAGLSRWRIFMPRQSGSWYHANFSSLAHSQCDTVRTDDPGVSVAGRETWHSRLPKRPGDFPKAVTFALTREEAEFVRGRMQEGCPGSLLAWLASEGSAAPTSQLWDEPAVQDASAEIQAAVELARRFSLLAEGAPLVYNLLLAERRFALIGNGAERIDQYRAELAEWFGREQQEAPFDAEMLRLFVIRAGGRVPDRQHSFVKAWAARTNELRGQDIVPDQTLRKLVEARERELKPGGRARLANPDRLKDWGGRVGVGRMDFRWFRVRQLLTDLHRGLVA